MALEATKLASTSIGDMSGPGEGRAAPGLPNSGFQKYWDSKICFVQFTFDTESTGLIIDRPVWEPRNWPARLEIWIDPSDYLALNGPGLLFLRIFVAALQCSVRHPGPGISASANNRGSPAPLNCPGNGWKPNLLSKQRIFMAQFFNTDIFHFSQLKIWTIQSDEDVCDEIWSMRHAWWVSC